jgi:hypothetical protein
VPAGVPTRQLDKDRRIWPKKEVVAERAAQDETKGRMTIPTESKPHPAVPESRTMDRAVTFSCAELKLTFAMAAEMVKNGLPFKRTIGPGWHKMHFLSS